MIINIKQIELVLNNTALTAYSLEKATGVRRSNIIAYRNGERKIENFNLKTLMSIQEWLNENYKIIYVPYIELLKGLQSDYEVGFIRNIVYVERGEFDERLGHAPIIDYFDPEEYQQFGNNSIVEIRQYSSLIEELNKHI